MIGFFQEFNGSYYIKLGRNRVSSKTPLIFIIAGEPSGDQLGADLMASSKSMRDVRFSGIGGEAMTAQGLKSIFPMEELSIMGVWGIIRDLPNLLSRIKFTVKTIQDLKPDVVITIDAPEFSFRVMKRLKQLPNRPRLIHYVAPTVWAWRPGRAKKISAFIDHLLCLYPFEPPYFERFGLKTTFVGHPIVKNSNILAIKRDPNLLCVLPGSRRSELEKLLPVFCETVTQLKTEIPNLKVIMPVTPSLEATIRQSTKNWPIEVNIVVGDEARQQAFQKATAALSKSGTVALQLSAARLPFVIAYKVGTLNKWLARLLITTPWACMVNIVMAFKTFGPDFKLNRNSSKLVPEPWIPEFIQENCTPERLVPALKLLLTQLDIREKQCKAMDEVMNLLKATKNAPADAILGEIKESCVSSKGVV